MPFKKLLFRKYPQLFRFLFAVSVVVLSSTTIFAQSGDGDVVVYVDSTAQFIRGFGAANIVDWYGNDPTMEEIEMAYGNDEGQLGFNILRLRISPNPNDWDNGNQVETARRAHELGALIWAAPWNPPESMAIYYDEADGSPQRKVDPEKYAEYAEHLEAFNVYMEERGVPLYGISVQNEPDYADDWTEWEPEEIVTFLRDHAPSINSRIIAPESFQFRRNYSDPILNDSLALAHTDIIGGHIYGGGLSAYPLAEEKGKEIWMTEHYTTSDRSANIWPDALGVGDEIQQVMKANWNAYIWWQIKRYYSPIHDGVDADTDSYEDDARSGTITKRGYVMGQYSKFIRPGYIRLHNDEPVGRGLMRVTATAFIDSASSKLVIVAVNGENADKDINFIVDGADAQLFNQYRTSETEDIEELESIEATDNRFMTTLPANSITTFVSSDIVVSNEQLVEAPNAYQLEQNYPNPFNPSTTIKYQLPASSEVSLKVYDMLGREVADLVNGRQAAGAHQARFDASNLSSGMYIYRLQAGSFVETRKMMLIK
ncbi:T9SS type A sorting domain-containing protein [Gracilimonas mengyeensis]|uniref:Glucuronoarabinoxylan endo-1,4-beta-xylanase n=1 Tax=Gracilimonas mengyeensis TaxID=1302730 RepID=A0A521AYC4_9BACT|nr:T9SS type A sorting domain-containing protein [Gracilimonas mengyeensis]SMO39815.1 glucuronoarabinoxylan endo-1,4-beta-xylanase [Gracilimonas mengyeensis]